MRGCLRDEDMASFGREFEPKCTVDPVLRVQSPGIVTACYSERRHTILTACSSFSPPLRPCSSTYLLTQILHAKL